MASVVVYSLVRLFPLRSNAEFFYVIKLHHHYSLALSAF